MAARLLLGSAIRRGGLTASGVLALLSCGPPRVAAQISAIPTSPAPRIAPPESAPAPALTFSAALRSSEVREPASSGPAGFDTDAAAPAVGSRRGDVSPAVRNEQAFSRLALGAGFSTLGFGFEAATPFTRHTDLRLNGNFFDLSQSFSVASIQIGADLSFRSAQLALDYQPLRWLGLQLSPGLLLYNRNELTGTATVKGGAAFFPGNGHYVSAPDDPVHGSLTVGMDHIAPTITLGVGSVLPRSGRHWSVPVRAGIAYIGSPSVSLALKGSACDANGQNCRPIPTAPDVLANIALEAAKISGDISFLQVYPIASIGISYNFRIRR